MKYLIGLLVLCTSFAFADTTATVLKTDQILVPLNQTCERYHSMYPPGIVCVKDEKFVHAYLITYQYDGKIKTARVMEHPRKQFQVDDEGNMIVQPFIMNYE